MGVYQQTISIGWMVGPALGGFLSELIGLRTIFLVAAQLEAAGFILGLLLVKEPHATRTRLAQAGSTRDLGPDYR